MENWALMELRRRHVPYPHVPVHREAHPRAQHGLLLGHNGVVLDWGRRFGAAGECMRRHLHMIY